MMTKKQIIRAHRKLWQQATAFDGYQPFGYDERTLNLTKPGFMAARKRLLRLYKQAQQPTFHKTGNGYWCYWN